eukprot:789269-Rhodomonas_salina.2
MHYVSTGLGVAHSAARYCISHCTRVAQTAVLKRQVENSAVERGGAAGKRASGSGGINEKEAQCPYVSYQECGARGRSGATPSKNGGKESFGERAGQSHSMKRNWENAVLARDIAQQRRGQIAPRYLADFHGRILSDPGDTARFVSIGHLVARPSGDR